MSSDPPQTAVADPDAGPHQRIHALERALAADPSSEVFVDLAMALLEGADPRRATLVLRAGLQAHRDHAEGRLLLAAALHRRGKTKTATRELAQLLTAHPRDVRAMKLLARCLISQRKLPEAMVILERARATDPSDGEVVTLLDQVHLARRGRETGALARALGDDDIVVREPDGRLTGLGQRPRAPRVAAFTGYIRDVAQGEHSEAPAPQGPAADPEAADLDATGSLVGHGPRPAAARFGPDLDATGVIEPQPEAARFGPDLDATAVLGDSPAAPQGLAPGSQDDTAQLDDATQEAIIRRAAALEAAAEGPAQGGERSAAKAAEVRHPFARRGTTASHSDDDEHTRPMSAPPEHFQVLSVALPPETEEAVVDPGPTAEQDVILSGAPEPAPPPVRSTLDPASEARADGEEDEDDEDDEESTLVGTDILPATAEVVTAGASETAQSVYLNPTMQLPSVAAGELGLGPARPATADRRTAPRRTVTRDIGPAREDFFGDEPTEALPASGGADGTPLIDEEDPDVISSARPIDVGRALGALSRRRRPAPEPVDSEGPSTVQLPKDRPSARGRKPARRAPAAPPPAARPPSGRPPSARPESARAERARSRDAGPAADLLDIPLNPGDFSGMPPKPAPSPRAMPADLITGQNPAVRGGGAPPPPPTASAGAARGPSGPVPGRRPPPAPSGPVPARRPAPGPSGPVPAPRTPAPRPASAPRPTPAPAPAPAPDYAGGGLGSYFDGRPVSNLTDHLAAIVDQQLDGGAAVTAAAAPDRRGRRWLMLLALAVALVVLSATLSAWRYRTEGRQLSQATDTLRRELSTGRFSAYQTVSAALQAAGADALSPLARIADRAIQLVGRPGLGRLKAERLALLARVEAERVALFGERGRLDEAKGLVARARAQAEAQPDTRVADAWLQWADGTPAEAILVGLDAATDSAAVAFAKAWLHHGAGQDDQALDFVRRAIHLDDRSVLARKLLADLKAARGENSAALEEYADILERLAPDHIDTRIAQARLQIDVNKRAGEAVVELKALLARADAAGLSPRQRAIIHDCLGRYAAHQGDLARARAAFRDAMEAAPEDPRFSMGLVRLDLDEYKLDQAEAVLTRAIETDPQAPVFRALLARAHMLRGDPSAALRALGSAARLDAEATLLKGRALLDLDKPKEAVATFEAAARLDGSLRDVQLYRLYATLAQGRQGKLVLEDLRAQRSAPAEDTRRLLDQALPFRLYADALAAQGSREEADDAYRLTLEVEARDALAHTGRCQLAARALKAREALGHCRKALAINPHHQPTARLAAEIAEAYQDHGAVVAALAPVIDRLDPAERRRLARAYLAVEDPAKAQALMDGADPPTRRAIEGGLALAAGRLREAEDALGPAADQLPDDAWAQLSYAQVLLQSGSAAKAIAYFRRAKTLSRDPRAALGAARAALRQGDHRAALTEAVEGESLASRGLGHPRLRAEALALQGHALLASGRLGQRKAEALFSRAMRLEPRLPAALMGLGRLAETQGRIQQAVDRYFEVTQVDRRDAEAHYRLGNLLIASPENRARARADLERAARLDPEGEWGVRAAKRLQEP